MSAFRFYKVFDLVVLSLIAVLAEVTSVMVGQALPLAGFYLSFSGMIAIIALIRWRSWGLVVSAASALPLVYFSNDATVQLALYYLISSSMVGLVPLIYKRVKTADVVGNGYSFQAYIISCYAILLAGRGFLGPVVGLTFMESLGQAVWQLSFSMIISMLFLGLFRKREGLLVDMSTYIIKEVIQE